MIKNLVKAAADLDRAGFHVEADLMDKIMQKVAEDLSEEESDANDFGFLGNDSDEEDDSVDYDDESEEEEEEEEEGGTLSAEECLEHCMMLSVDEKCALMKSLLDSLCE